MGKKWKKCMSLFLVLALVLSCSINPVYAEETDPVEETDSVEKEELSEQENGDGESSDEGQPESPVCICETKCDEDEVNEECPVCGAEGADLTLCTGETEETADETETDPEESIYSSQPANEIQPFAMDNANNAGDFNVTGNTGWTYDEGEKKLTFTASGEYIVTGDGTVTTERIIISGNNITVTITLDNVNIDVSDKANQQAFLAKDYGQSNVDLTIILQGTNKLKSGENRGGITWNNTDDNSTLTIKGNGSLIVTGGKNGAGIGASWDNQGTKNITIMGGTISASGGASGAGIGSGSWGSAKNITITGGTISAFGGSRGAGIGGGEGGSAENIIITGGTISAFGGSRGAGIGGGGYNGSAKNITITGGTITAVGSDGGAGIGGGYNGSTENITITGGSVKASGTGYTPIDIGTTPIDSNGNQVYLAKLENQDGINQVIVDSGANEKIFTRAGNHPDGDTAFYLYLTGQGHTITTDIGTYRAVWDNSLFKWILPAPKVTIDTSKTTASSITVNALANQETYGAVEYSIDGEEWQDSNVLENLHSSGYGGNNYTVYARYKGNDSYFQSEAGKLENVSTNAAAYTITIPNSALTADDTNSKNQISVQENSAFDLGHNGHVDVKVKNNGEVTSDAKLNLIRLNDTTNHTITSALLINGTELGDINKEVAAFTMDSKTPVSVSFAKPAETNIPAGTYKGTITFEVSYSEEAAK